eukprot:CAMPEP_0175986394 /NCGR_PEP_ID=MMETSP0108-20121206/50124_1 /TAXON_ID=195067 ORGANISM="Goniomonas pacifica, Strain CCMP1869" /NCGR_SAMPLE_ID=MMETSP0108 /ASSEMBLY_ACC=CAM_ASM_000204 /LENGTH=184 /DNA_ID=CAMNT_0017317545 /DNA_START=67 /DNA_END=621 /DNA_ORIENTATION=-
MPQVFWRARNSLAKANFDLVPQQVCSLLVAITNHEPMFSELGNLCQGQLRFSTTLMNEDNKDVGDDLSMAAQCKVDFHTDVLKLFRHHPAHSSSDIGVEKHEGLLRLLPTAAAKQRAETGVESESRVCDPDVVGISVHGTQQEGEHRPQSKRHNKPTHGFVFRKAAVLDNPSHNAHWQHLVDGC